MTTTTRTRRTLAVASPGHRDGTTEVFDGIVRALAARGIRWSDRSEALDHLDEVLPDVVAELGGEIESMGPEYRVNLTAAKVPWGRATLVATPEVAVA